MYRHITVALFAVLPAMAIAETQLERLETLSERMNTVMIDAMIRMAVKEGANPDPLRAAIPDGTWDDAYREAGACMLDRFKTANIIRNRPNAGHDGSHDCANGNDRL